MTTVNVTTQLYVYSSFSVILEIHYNIYSTQLKKNNVYSPHHFWSSYKVVFGHLYSVKLTVLSKTYVDLDVGININRRSGHAISVLVLNVGFFEI